MTESATIERYQNEQGVWEERIVPPKPKMLTVADIEAADDVLEQVFLVPEWGGTVRLRQFTKAREFEMRVAATIGGQVDVQRLEMLLLTTAVIDPPLTPEHIGMLLEKSNSSIDRVLEQVTKMNRVAVGSAEAARAQFPQGPGLGVPISPNEGPRVPDGAPDEEGAPVG